MFNWFRRKTPIHKPYGIYHWNETRQRWLLSYYSATKTEAEAIIKRQLARLPGTEFKILYNKQCQFPKWKRQIN